MNRRALLGLIVLTCCIAAFFVATSLIDTRRPKKISDPDRELVREAEHTRNLLELMRKIHEWEHAPTHGYWRVGQAGPITSYESQGRVRAPGKGPSASVTAAAGPWHYSSDEPASEHIASVAQAVKEEFLASRLPPDHGGRGSTVQSAIQRYCEETWPPATVERGAEGKWHWGTPVCWVEKLSDYSYELEHCRRFGPSPARMPTETEQTSSVWRYDRLKGTVQPVNEEAEAIAGTADAPALGEE